MGFFLQVNFDSRWYELRGKVLKTFPVYAFFRWFLKDS
jgi:hypothetical protein